MKGITFPQAFRTAFQQPLTYIRKLRVKLVCKSHEYCDQTLNAKMRLVLFCHQDIFLSFLAMVRCKNKSFNKRFFSSLDFSTLISLDPDPRTRVQTQVLSARNMSRALLTQIQNLSIFVSVNGYFTLNSDEAWVSQSIKGKKPV